jgi:hypothetical protein
MASIESTQATPDAPAGWLARCGWSGKLFVAGGLVGLVAAFLPLISFSMEMMGGFMSGNQTLMVVDDWRGKLSLPGYLAALAFAWLLYPPGRSPRKWLAWAGVGVGVGLVLLGIGLLIGTLQSRGGSDMMMGMASTRLTPQIGAFVNLAAAAAVAVAGMIKGREEKLF